MLYTYTADFHQQNVSALPLMHGTMEIFIGLFHINNQKRVYFATKKHISKNLTFCYFLLWTFEIFSFFLIFVDMTLV